MKKSFIVPLSMVYFATMAWAMAQSVAPAKSKYRVLWQHTIAYTTTNESDARKSYADDIQRVKYGWASGMSNVLQKQDASGKWVDIERVDQKPDEEGP